MHQPAPPPPPASGGRTLIDACTFPCGSLAGIPVRVHALFAVALVLGVLSQLGRPWQAMVWAALLYGPVLALTVVLHELGHCAATRRCGGSVHSILLWPLGGLAYVGHTASPGRDLVVAVAGPATHVPQAALWVALELASMAAAGRGARLQWAVWPPWNNVWLALVTGAVQLNVSLFAFNLLVPAYPLDGGRVFADALLLCGVPVKLAAYIVSGVGVAGGVVVVGACIGLRAFVGVAVGAWILFASFELLSAAVGGRAAEHPLFDFGGGGSGGGGESVPPPGPPQAMPPPR